MKSFPTPSQALSLLTLFALPVSSVACGDGSTTILPLPTLGGALTWVSGLSAAGQLTGYSQSSDSANHAFLFANGTMLDLNAPGSAFSQGVAVNSAGQVVGDMATGVFETHAFFFGDGSLTDLGTLGGSFSFAVAINEAGHAVGNSLLGDGFSFGAFTYANGTVTSLGTLGGSASFANGMNQAGHVVGNSALDFNFESHAFLSTNGVMVDLGTLGGSYSTAYAVNDQNVVVGESEMPNLDTHAFSFSNGVMTDLGTLGGTYSSAVAVNALGQIIGVATTTNDLATHGFIHVNGVMTDLGTLGGTDSEPLALDNLGRVVGYANLTDGSDHAFLWQNGTMVDLNTVLPANSGWELISADFINDAGRIAGYGLLNGVDQAYVLDLGSDNNPPVAVAGSDQNAECNSTVTLNAAASSDPDGDALSYQWSESGVVLGTNITLSVALSTGNHSIRLLVADPCGMTAEDFVSVTVADTTAPEILGAPASLTVSAGPTCEGVVPDLTTSVLANDNCTPANQLLVAQNPAAGTLLTKGSHPVTVTVADASGNLASTNITHLVVDTTAPNITSVSVNPSVLSPPNGKSVPVTVSVVANDACDSVVVSQITGVTCNEASAPDDIQITGALTVNLAAVKGTGGNTRVYTVSVECVDGAGNAATGFVTVSVPKNNGGGGKKP